MTLDDIKAPMRHMARRYQSVEPLIENVGETGCLEPALTQNTKFQSEKWAQAKNWDSIIKH